MLFAEKTWEGREQGWTSKKSPSEGKGEVRVMNRTGLKPKWEQGGKFATSTATRRGPSKVRSKTKVDLRFRVDNPTKDSKTRKRRDSFYRGFMKGLQGKGRRREGPIDLTKTFTKKSTSVVKELLSQMELDMGKD